MNENGKRVLADETNRVSYIGHASQVGCGVAAAAPSAYAIPMVDFDTLLKDETALNTHDTKHNIQKESNSSTDNSHAVQGVHSQTKSESGVCQTVEGMNVEQSTSPTTQYMDSMVQSIPCATTSAKDIISQHISSQTNGGTEVTEQVSCSKPSEMGIPDVNSSKTSSGEAGEIQLPCSTKVGTDIEHQNGGTNTSGEMKGFQDTSSDSNTGYSLRSKDLRSSDAADGVPSDKGEVSGAGVEQSQGRYNLRHNAHHTNSTPHPAAEAMNTANNKARAPCSARKRATSATAKETKAPSAKVAKAAIEKTKKAPVAKAKEEVALADKAANARVNKATKAPPKATKGPVAKTTKAVKPKVAKAKAAKAPNAKAAKATKTKTAKGTRHTKTKYNDMANIGETGAPAPDCNTATACPKSEPLSNYTYTQYNAYLAANGHTNPKSQPTPGARYAAPGVFNAAHGSTPAPSYAKSEPLSNYSYNQYYANLAANGHTNPGAQTTSGAGYAAPGGSTAAHGSNSAPGYANNTSTGNTGSTQQSTGVVKSEPPHTDIHTVENPSDYVISYTHVRKNTQDSHVDGARYVAEPQDIRQAYAYAQAQMHIHPVDPTNPHAFSHTSMRMYNNTVSPRAPSTADYPPVKQETWVGNNPPVNQVENSMVPVPKQESGPPASVFPCIYWGAGLAGGCPYGYTCQYSHTGEIPILLRAFYLKEVSKLQATGTIHTGYDANDAYATISQALAPHEEDLSSSQKSLQPSYGGPQKPMEYNKWIPAPQAFQKTKSKRLKLDPGDAALAQQSAVIPVDGVQMVSTVVIPPLETDVFSLPRLQRKDFDKWYQERIRDDPQLVLDEDQLRCVRLTVVEEKNVFLTGSAGVGKSHTTATVRDFLKRIYERDDYPDKVVVAAPTGVAATHIEGTTINSATGVGIPNEVADFQRMNKPAFFKLWTESVELFMVDEISMVSGEFLDCLDSQIRLMCLTAGKFTNKKVHEIPPFGGIQIFFCGDFLQLPPIEGQIPFETMKKLDPLQLKKGLAIEKYRNERMEESERSYFLNRGFAFSASTWGRLDLVTITLSRCYRQEGHQLFVHHLNQIRNGRADQRTINYFNQFRTPLPEDRLPTTLYPFNRKVQQLNEKKLAALCSQQLTFHAHDHVNGLNTCRDDTALWESELYKSGSVSERTLKLKTGARVMLIRNIDLKGTDKLKPLINGSTGMLTNWTSRAEAEQAVTHRMNYLSTRVEVLESALSHGEYSRGSRACEISEERACEVEHELLQIVATKFKWKLPVVEFNNGRQLIVLPALFRNEVMGQGMTYRLQIPLKLGWAVSIHKSQGMTLTAGNVSTAGAFAEGQSYVALSRVTGPEALYMIDLLTMKDIKMPRQPVIYNQIMSQLDIMARELCSLTGEKKWLTMGPRDLVDNVKLYESIPREMKLNIVNLVKRLTPWARTNMENEVKHWNTITPKQARNFASTGSNIQCFKCRKMGHYSSKCPTAGFTSSSYR